MVSAGFLRRTFAISAPPGYAARRPHQGVFRLAHQSLAGQLRARSESSQGRVGRWPLLRATVSTHRCSSPSRSRPPSHSAEAQRLRLRSWMTAKWKRSRAEVVLSASISVVVEQERNQRQIGVLRHSGAYPAFAEHRVVQRRVTFVLRRECPDPLLNQHPAHLDSVRPACKHALMEESPADVCRLPEQALTRAVAEAPEHPLAG